ncbi:MAG: UDP-glucose--hexose-1-phosphate uridylyltransferase [Cyclobacteriaceae bacterium]
MDENLFADPHRRYNPLTDEWVLVSPQRMKRPWQGRVESVPELSSPSYDPNCYLCPGNKRNSGQQNPDYEDVFVFTNDFPALTMEAGNTAWKEGVLQAEGNPGTCRVLCFSPDHSRTLAELSVPEISKVVTVWKSEFMALSALSEIRNVQIFENKGELLGCSNPHPHGQIWAEGVIPVEIEKRRFHQQAYYEARGSSLLGDYLLQERERDERVITSNSHFTALVPFWAVWPYEVMIIAHRHFSAIADMTGEEETAFADILSEIAIRYDNLFRISFPYSSGMMNAPVNTAGTEGWHFHFSFYPPLLRSATVRKFMVGYEMFANPQRDFTPEYAAKVLKGLPKEHYSN